ncbi:ulp1 protease family, C-terminal catalytic domain-containing protein [Tanacetum coccineum]
MDIREEIRLSKEDKLPESSGLPHSGQQRSYLIEMSILWRVRFISVLGKLGKIELAKKVVDISLNQGIYAKVNRWEICVAIADGQFKQLLGAHEGIVSGRGSTVASKASKVTGRGSSRKWITSDMAIAAKASRQVLNPKPVSEFNPTVGHVVPIKDKESDVVKVKNPADVVYKSRNQKRPLKKPAAVVEKPDAVVEKPDAVLDKKSAPAKKPTSVVVNYPAELDQEKDKEKHKASAKEPVSIVDRVCEVAKHIMFHVEDALKNDAIEKASDVNDSDALKNTAADVKEKSDGKDKKSTVDKDNDKALFQKKKLNVVSKDKPKSTVEKASDVVSDKPVVKKSVNAPVVAAVESVVEKDNPKVMSKVSDKPSSVVGKDKDKPKNIALDVVKEKFKPNQKKLILSKEDDRKKKLKGNSKKDVSDSKLETDVVDYSSDEADRKRKKLNIKAGLKRKRSGSDSSELDTKTIKRLISKLEKKKEESDEESDEGSVPKKGKKKEKQLTPKEAAYEEYLSSFPSFHARTTPSSLFSAIRNSRVDILGILTDIGFSDKIDVTPSKIYDMLGVPFEGYSLFDLDEREVDHEFVRKWAGQFYPLELKKVRVNDIAQKLIVAQEIDFLFKVNFLTLFTNTIGKADGLKGQIYLDVVTRLREDSALFKRAEEKLAAICSERVFLEDLMRKASSAYPGDGKFVELQAKYVQVFRDPISFDVDMDVVNESNGDDDNDNDGDGNGDEEDANDGDENGSNPSFGFSKISLDDFGNDIGPTEKESVDPVDPAEQEIVVEGDPAEECQIMSTPENYTQWLEKNLDLVGEGDLFGDDSATRELMNQGPVTPERTPTQKASPIPKKRVVKPSPYILSPYMNKKTNVVPKITRLEFILGNSVFAIENVFEAHSGEYSVYGLHLNMETLAPGLWINANVIDCWGAILNHEERFRVADSKTRHFFPTGCITQLMFDGTLATDDAKWDSFSNQVKAQFSGNVDGLALQGIDLKKLFSRHLKEYGHDRHTKIAKLIPKIPKLKWRTKGNHHDCGIFTMLHMECYNAGAVANWDCGLVAESGLQLDMLRRLRFKFSTKILLHEINVHAQKMLDLAKEFDKLESDEKMSIIVNALKNRKERDRIKLPEFQTHHTFW